MKLSISWQEEKGVITQSKAICCFVKTSFSNGSFHSNGCLYNAQNGKWTCQGDFQFQYVFPVCGMYKKDGGKFLRDIELAH